MIQIKECYIMSSIDIEEIKECYKVQSGLLNHGQLGLVRIESSCKTITVYGYLHDCLLAYLEDEKTSDSDIYKLFNQWEHNAYSFNPIIKLKIKESYIQTLHTYNILDAQVMTYNEILSSLDMNNVIDNLTYYQNIYKVKAFAIPEYSSPIFHIEQSEDDDYPTPFNKHSELSFIVNLMNVIVKYSDEDIQDILKDYFIFGSNLMEKLVIDSQLLDFGTVMDLYGTQFDGEDICGSDIFLSITKKYRQAFLRDKQSVINDIVFDLDSDFINQYQYLSNLFDQEKP